MTITDGDKIVRETENAVRNDIMSGVVSNLLERLKTIRNGATIPINPPRSNFHIGEDAFNSKNKDGEMVSDVLVFGAPRVNQTGGKIATLNSAVKQTDLNSVDIFPELKDANVYNDILKDAETYSSVVAQIYALTVFLSRQDVDPKFKNDNVEKNLSRELPDNLRAHLTKNLSKALESVDVSGEIYDVDSGICKFIIKVLSGNADGVGDLRDAFQKTLNFVVSDESEMEWQTGGTDGYKPETQKYDRPSESVKQFNRMCGEIEHMAEHVKNAVMNLKNVIDPENITYGDLIYLMTYGGLGLNSSEINAHSTGESYYDSFLHIVENYSDLKRVSNRISIEVCGKENYRIAKMAGAILLLMRSVSNDLVYKHYNVIEGYMGELKDIKKEIDEVESGKKEKTPTDELVEKYDELFTKQAAAVKKVISKLNNTVMGTSAEVIKRDFNTVVNSIISKVSYDGHNELDIDSATNLGNLLIATLSGDIRKTFYSDIKDNILDGQNFSNSIKYINAINNKSDVDKAIVSYLSENNFERLKALGSDELHKYYKEYELANSRSELYKKYANLTDKRTKNKSDEDTDEILKKMYDDILNEVKEITNDQIRDALIGNGGLLTNGYGVVSEGKETVAGRAEVASKAIVFYLINKSNVFGDTYKGKKISIKAFNDMMNSILNNEKTKKTLAEELKIVYNSDDKGAVKTLVDSIKAVLGAEDKYRNPATSVLLSLTEYA